MQHQNLTKLPSDDAKAEEFCKKADTHFANHDYAKAIDLFERAVDIASPQYNCIAFTKLETAKGLQSADERKFDRALKHFQSALRIDPYNPEPRCRIAKLYEDMGNFDHAEKEFNEALSKCPDGITLIQTASFLKRQSERFKKLNDPQKAESYTRAQKEKLDQMALQNSRIEKELSRVDIFVKSLEQYYSQTGQTLPAVTPIRLRRSIELCDLGIREQRKKNRDDINAIQLFSQAISLCPYNMCALEMRGNLYAIKENFYAAIQDFTQIIKWDCNDIIAAISHFHIGTCYLRLTVAKDAGPRGIISYYAKLAKASYIRYMLLDVYHQAPSVSIQSVIKHLSSIEKFNACIDGMMLQDFVGGAIETCRASRPEDLPANVASLQKISNQVNNMSEKDCKDAVTEANTAFQEKKYGKAIYFYTQAISVSIETDTAELYRQRGLAYAATNQDQEAIENFIIGSWIAINGISHDPQYKIYETVALIRDTYLRKDCFEESILGHCSVRNFFFTHFLDELISHLNSASNNRDISTADLKRAKILSESIVVARKSIQSALIGDHNNQKVTDMLYKTSLQIFKDNANVFSSLSYPSLLQPKINKMITEARNIWKKLDDDFSEALTCKATQQRDAKNYDTAIMCYTRAIELNDMNAESYVGRAMTYWSMNKLTEALADFSRASLLSSSNLELDALYRKCYCQVYGEKVEKEIETPAKQKRRPKTVTPSKTLFQPRAKPKPIDAKARMDLEEFWANKRKAAVEEQKKAVEFLEKQKNENIARQEKSRVAANQSKREKRKAKRAEAAAKKAEKSNQNTAGQAPTEVSAPLATPTPTLTTPTPTLTTPAPTSCHSRENENPQKLIPMDSRLRGNDSVAEIKATEFEKFCLRNLNAVGKAYVVGGAVLSRLQKQPFNSKADIDIVTSASFEAIKTLFAPFDIKQDAHKPNRFSFSWLNGEMIKVEIWCNPKIECIPEEASTRDFTINAFYMDENGNVFAGTPDAKNHLTDNFIHTIIDAKESLTKDPIRIFRALDLSAKTGKNLSKELASAVQDKLSLLTTVNPSELNAQILKFLSNSRADLNFLKWLESGVIRTLFPEIADDLNNDKEWIVSQLREIKSRDRGSSVNEIFQIFLTAVLKQRDREFNTKSIRKLIEDNENNLNDIMERNFLFKKQYRFLPNLNHFLTGIIEKRKQEVRESTPHPPPTASTSQLRRPAACPRDPGAALLDPADKPRDDGAGVWKRSTLQAAGEGGGVPSSLHSLRYHFNPHRLFAGSTPSPANLPATSFSKQSLHR